MHRLRIIGATGVALTMMLSASVALAEERSETTGVQSTSSVRANVRAVREETKSRIENAREEAKTRIETAREEAKTRMETRREDAKKRISDLRDKKQQELATKLAGQFEELNEKWTDRFTEQLDKLSKVLVKVQERADAAKSKGRDTSVTNSAIDTAETAIATAQSAVTAQASKTYTLDTSSVITRTATTTSSGQNDLLKALRVQFQTLHKTLFGDLYAIRDGVMKDAQRAVQDAVKSLGQATNL